MSGVLVASVVGLEAARVDVAQSRGEAQLQDDAAKMEQVSGQNIVDASSQSQSTAQGDAAQPDTSESASPQIKYSTSSDPRSLAYSTTPPLPPPGDFSIQITHAGQLAVGDIMSYNSVKGEKSYYNGDLLLSPSTVMISKSGFHWAPITVSSPTTKPISMPSVAFGSSIQYLNIAFQGTTSPPAALSHNMIVNMWGPLPVGTYQLHVVAMCSDPAGDGCQSDGFITVNVVE